MQRKREKSLNELMNDEIIRLSVCDEYFAGEHIFNVLDKEIVVNDAVLADVISKLPQAKRDVILLSFFAVRSVLSLSARKHSLFWENILRP